MPDDCPGVCDELRLQCWGWMSMVVYSSICQAKIKRSNIGFALYPTYWFLMRKMCDSILDKVCMNAPLRFAESELSKVCVVLASGVFAWKMSAHGNGRIGDRDGSTSVNNSEKYAYVWSRADQPNQMRKQWLPASASDIFPARLIFSAFHPNMACANPMTKNIITLHESDDIGKGQSSNWIISFLMDDTG